MNSLTSNSIIENSIPKTNILYIEQLLDLKLYGDQKSLSIRDDCLNAQLNYASMENNLIAIKLILQSNFDLKCNKGQALINCILKSYHEAALLLLDYEKDPEILYKILYLSTTLHNNFIAKKILVEFEFGAKINKNKLLLDAAFHGNNEIIELLLELGADVHTENDRSLILAVSTNKYQTVKILLDHDANIDAENCKALLNAIKFKNYDIIKLLLENGANINILNENNNNNNLNYLDKTPILLNENDKIIQLLLDYGINFESIYNLLTKPHLLMQPSTQAYVEI